MGEGPSSKPVQGTWYSSQSPEIEPSPQTIRDIPRSPDRLKDFEGFSNPREDQNFTETNRKISLLRRAAGGNVAISSGQNVLSMPDSPRRALENATSSATPEQALGFYDSRDHDTMVHPVQGERPVVVQR